MCWVVECKWRIVKPELHLETFGFVMAFCSQFESCFIGQYPGYNINSLCIRDLADESDSPGRNQQAPSGRKDGIN